MLHHDERLRALRDELTRRGLDGFVVPLTDEHMSEYVGGYAQRLAWLTGFRGSAGTAAILPAEAALFVDGRYAIQARQQVDEQLWHIQQLPRTSVTDWLCEHAQQGARIGCDPWLHTGAWMRAARSALEQRGAELVPVHGNPVDAIWTDRPGPSDAKACVYAERFAGRSSADKRREIAEWLIANGADAVLLAALDSVAWAFNIRGEDVEYTPVVLAYGLVHADASADLFMHPSKLTESVIAHLGASVRLCSRESFATSLGALRGKTIVVDPERTVGAIVDALQTGGATVLEARDPVVLAKAIKNEVEIAGHQAAQRRDGAALSRFLHWMASETSAGNPITELSAATRLREFREAAPELRNLSFATISAFGQNSAIIHYHPSAATSRAIVPGGLYLVDSGGQYIDATTDVTRTIAIGTPTQEARDRYTRVLKGHIAFACAVFPVGTRGVQLDALARQYLWRAGLDYAHGTGHGVGAHLCVHEGPQLINGTLRADQPLVPGMILSNEPGYYKPGEYGIRIENLMLVVKREIDGAERDMLAFEVLTFVPLDRSLIDSALLTAEERAWIDRYHAEVARIVAPELEGAARTWLIEATVALE